jgi:hypothetical protein
MHRLSPGLHTPLQLPASQTYVQNALSIQLPSVSQRCAVFPLAPLQRNVPGVHEPLQAALRHTNGHGAVVN